MNLEGKRVLITGGGSGIGLELARRLAEAGSEVTIAGRDEAKLERARSETPALQPLRLDVSSEGEAVNAFARLSSEAGGLDLLVNGAGVMRGGALTGREAASTTVEELDVNLGGAVRMTRLALPLLANSTDPGVLFMSSAVALASVPGFAVYAATKAAVHSLARSLRAELADTPVRVFEVLPPVVDTELSRRLDVPKLPASAVVDAIVAGLGRDREEIRVAQVRPLAVLARISPRLADRIVQRALRPSPDRL